MLMLISEAHSQGHTVRLNVEHEGAHVCRHGTLRGGSERLEMQMLREVFHLTNRPQMEKYCFRHHARKLTIIPDDGPVLQDSLLHPTLLIRPGRGNILDGGGGGSAATGACTL
jgi:hypothetical protein